MCIYLIEQQRMYSSRSTLRNILLWCLGIFFLSLAFLYSDFTMVGFSDFKFLSGTTEVNTLSLEMTWWNTTWFSVIIYNKESVAKTYKLWFVDAGVTNDSLAQKACLSVNETGNFWQYITGSTSLFTLPAGGSGTYTLSVKFPATYSGLYHWCVMFFPSTVDGATDMNTLPRRWWFIDALVHPNAVMVTVKAFPSNRVYQATNNANRWVIKFYTTNKQFVSSSNMFDLNSAGTGEWLVNIPAGTYYVFFKWQSHLASYLSGVVINGMWWYFFDFTTWTNLYSVQNLNDSVNDWMKYQSAWDLKPIVGDYDHIINGNDISIIITTFPQAWVDALEPRNLNGDTEINSSDIGIVWTNFLKEDPFIWWVLFTWQ